MYTGKVVFFGHSKIRGIEIFIPNKIIEFFMPKEYGTVFYAKKKMTETTENDYD